MSYGPRTIAKSFAAGALGLGMLVLAIDYCDAGAGRGGRGGGVAVVAVAATSAVAAIAAALTLPTAFIIDLQEAVIITGPVEVLRWRSGR